MILTNSDIPGWYMYIGGTSNQTLLRPTLLGNCRGFRTFRYFLPMMTSMVFAEAGAHAA